MQDNPFAKYANPGAPVAGPLPSPPDPYKQAAEQRAQQDQALQQQANARAEEAAARADRAEARAQRTEARQAQESALGTESERTAGFLSGRAKDAALRLAAAAKKDPSAQNPTLGVEMVRGVFGDTAANYLTDSERQQVRAAQIDIIDAGLTLGTGAAYTKEQLEGYREVYFPKLGDDEATIASKREALRSLLVNAQTKAGRAAPDIEEAIAALDALGQGGTGGGDWTIDDTVKKWGEAYYDENGNPLGPDGGGAFDKDGNYIGLVGSATYEGPNPEVSAAADRYEELDGKAGALQLARSGITFGLTDEASGIGQVIGKALTGDFNVSENYQFGRDVRRELERRARERTGIAGTAAELVGAGGAIRTAGNAALNAARGLRAGGQAVNRAAIQGRMVRNATVEGAGAGALGGFGYGEGAEQSGTNALLGAAAGGVIGNVGQRVGNALANRTPPSGSPPSGGQVMQAADDLGIQPTPAVVGGRTTQILTGGARQGFISDRPISRAVERMEGQGQAARDRIAANAGQVLDAEDAGDVVRQAANVYSQRTSQIGGNLYTRADRRAGGIKLPLPKAVQAADAELAQLAKGPGGTESQLYKDLAKLKQQMEGGQFEVDGIRAFRSRIRTEMTERGLRGTPQDVAYGRILEAAEDDMITGLIAAGKQDAAGALKTAAAFWRKRVETIDQVLEPVIGKNSPKSGEQIVSALENMANPKSGNAARLRGLFKAMPKEESRAVAATLINRMGQPTKGSANLAEEGGFSFSTFLTNYNALSPRAKAAIFDGETRDALGKLALVSQGVKQAGGAANTSNTAGAAVVQTFVSGGLWYLEPMTAVAGAAGQFAIGKLLASPKFARLIAGAPKANTPQARKALSARLANLAKAEPAIANEIGLYRSALDRAANDNAVVMQSAAQDENAQERRQEP